METLEQREQAMRDLLKRAPELQPGTPIAREEGRLWKECLDAGYLEGVEYDEMISGRITIEIRFTPRITTKGLYFLEETSPDVSEKPSADCEETRQNEIHKHFETGKEILRRFWALFCGLGVVVTVFGWTKIKRFVLFLLSFFK